MSWPNVEIETDAILQQIYVLRVRQTLSKIPAI
jgi:hypothetical protein